MQKGCKIVISKKAMPKWKCKLKKLDKKEGFFFHAIQWNMQNKAEPSFEESPSLIEE